MKFSSVMVSARVWSIALATLFFSATAYGQNDVFIVGTFSYAATASTVTLEVAQIDNLSSTRTTGTLRLEVWLFPSQYSGSSLSGYRVAAQQLATNNGRLPPGQAFYGTNGSATLSNLPTSGSWYPTLILSEYTQSCGSSDGFCAVSYGNFNNRVTTFAGTSDTVGAVVEFYNYYLDNYFITADSSEAAAIDNGSAGPGWTRTGYWFMNGGNTSVCRFYGSQSPGPNSHFYTADAGECASLKQLQAITPATQKRWNYESLDFFATAPTNGICPTGRVPVYRAYNNGSSRGVDSNHRISTSLTAIQEVVARGWKNEGVVMCALGSSGTSSGTSASANSAKLVGGTWTFTENMNQFTFTDSYSLTSVDSSPDSSGNYTARGTNINGSPVMAQYSSSLGKWELLDSHASFDNYFTFTFEDNNHISGCYYYVSPKGGDIGSCYPLTGSRSPLQ